MRLYLTVAIAMLAASPVLAQNNATAPANSAETTAANVTAGNATDNAAMTAMPGANATAPADTSNAVAATETPAPPPQPKSFPWGVLGLLGLIGLLGSRKSAS
jgi:MYXO-CTERM domain-containing protein